MIIDIWFHGIWAIISALLIDDSFFSDEFIASYRAALEGIAPMIDALEPWTFILPFQAYGIILNFVIAAWILYWPVRLIRWILEWARGKAGNS